MRSPLNLYRTKQSRSRSWVCTAIMSVVLGLCATLSFGASTSAAPLPSRSGGTVTNRAVLPGRPVPAPSKAPAAAAPTTVRPSRTNFSALPSKKSPEPLAGPKGPNVAVKGTNAVAGTNAAATPAGWYDRLANLRQKFEQFRGNPRALGIAAIALCVLLALVLVLRGLLRRGRKTSHPAQTGKQVAADAGKISSCNVLLFTPDARRLWHFDARSHGFALSREETRNPGEQLPGHLVSKTWSALFQKKLNVALLPPEQVFLKVLQLPRSTHEEMLSMVELQVEKLSPMPLAQVVWGIQVLPRPEGNLDTVVVMIVSRAVVEDFLGRLESEGYLTDRLELPLLDQLQATPVTNDGACIYPITGAGRDMALVAWWSGGVLQNLDIATLPPLERAASVREQLLQMLWAGELEGWVTGQPKWTLVASPEAAAEWEPALREGLEQQIEVIEPLRAGELAARTASRAANSGAGASLMPAEFGERYRQQFVDRLWMRGLAAIVALYMLGVLVYFVALGAATYRTRTIENRVASLGTTYTNALQLKAQSKVLQDRTDLKYAALDCWSVVAKHLPEGVVLDSFNFSDGRRLTLMGSAPADKSMALVDFEAALRKAVVNGQPLFGKVDNISYNANLGGAATLMWNIGLEMKRTEAQ